MLSRQLPPSEPPIDSRSAAPLRFSFKRLRQVIARAFSFCSWRGGGNGVEWRTLFYFASLWCGHFSDQELDDAVNGFVECLKVSAVFNPKHITIRFFVLRFCRVVT